MLSVTPNAVSIVHVSVFRRCRCVALGDENRPDENTATAYGEHSCEKVDLGNPSPPLHPLPHPLISYLLPNTSLVGASLLP